MADWEPWKLTIAGMSAGAALFAAGAALMLLVLKGYGINPH